MGGDAHPDERRAAAKANRVRRPRRCRAERTGEVGRRNSGSIAYRATSGRLPKRGTGKRQCWRQGCGQRRPRRVGRGLWPRGENKRWTRLDIARKRGGNKGCCRTRKRKTCEATPVGLVDEPKQSRTGTIRTETCAAPNNRHVDASRDALLAIYVLFLLFSLYAPCILS